MTTSNRLRLGLLPTVFALTLALLSACGGGGGSDSTDNGGAPATSTLTVNHNDGGAVTSATAGIDCGSDCTETYAAGSSVTLSARPLAGFNFAGWSDAAESCGTNADCPLTLQGAGVTATATFSPQGQSQFALQVTVAATGSGSVSSAPTGIDNCTATCAKDFNAGTTVTLTATPTAGFTFAGWSTSGAACPGTGTCQVTMSAARSVTATFTAVPVTHRLTVSAPSNGTIAATNPPAGIVCGTAGSDCLEVYAAGTTVTLQAAPSGSGFSFANWGGDCASAGTASTCTLVMSSDRNVSATFAALPPNKVALTVARAGTGTGNVVSTPAGIDCGVTCNANFDQDSNVTLTATAAADSTFGGWTGDCTGTTNPCVVTLSAAKNVAASFNRITHILSVSKTGSGTISSSPAGIDCGTTCSAAFGQGQQVTLTATPAQGFALSSWGGACSGNGACVVTMSSAQSVSATFAALPPDTKSLNVTVGSGGSVASTPQGITCSGTTCSATFASNASVSLQATPDTGFSFAGWSGGGCALLTNPCVVTLAADTSVSASFSRITFALTVSKVGSGSGTVSSTPAGIDCGATCSTTVGSGNTVTLTATPAAGSSFAGWSGACAGAVGSTCTVTVNAASAVTATFNLLRTLSVAITGSGALGSSPAGISCSTSCNATFTEGTVVTLAATPLTGFTFGSWGGACSGNGACVVTMSANASVTATFNVIPPTTFSLNLVAGTGGGVTSSPTGIDCGSTCAASFNAGTSVTLTANPQAGFSFSGWTGGGCAALTNPCTITLNANTTVSAAFTPISRTLTVTKSGTGIGTVSSSPAGIDCGATCSASYPNGTSVTLTAAPAIGSSLGSWTGACAGVTGATCTLTLTAATSVGVSFTANVSNFAITVSKDGTGSGTVTSTPAGVNCGAACTASFPSGTNVTLTAAPASGSTFGGWTGACAGVTTNTCSLAVSAALSVGATFNASAALDCAATNVRCVSQTAGANQEYVTLQAAADAVVPGDTVLVFAGNYTGFTVSRSGTSTQPIRFLANDASVVIANGGNSEADGVRLQNVNYVVIEGFVIRNATGSSPRIHRCIAARGATADAPMVGNVMRGNQCTDADAEGLYASQYSAGLIEGNIISGSGKNGQARMHGIYLANAGSDGTTIRGNIISNNPNAESEGIHCNGDLSIGGDGLISNLVIEGNRITGSGNNGLNFDGVQDSLIQNNIVYGNSHHAMRAYAIDGAAGPRGMRIVNNTFDTNGGWAVKFSEDVGGHVFFNNILLGSSGSLAVGSTSLTSNNNIVQGTFSTDSETTTVNLATWRTRTGQDSVSQTSTASALFTNSAAADYSLKVGSPAREFGVTQLGTVKAPTTDFAGAARPRGTAYDAGALEAAP